VKATSMGSGSSASNSLDAVALQRRLVNRNLRGPTEVVLE